MHTDPVANTVVSSDGTTLAFERTGAGPVVILVDGALSYRRLGQSRELAQLLSHYFTVITYDRRGRGDSGDVAPYSVAREVEDIAALLASAGGSASLWGMSSGAALALEAAAQLEGVTRLATYEAPFIVDGSRPTTEQQWADIGKAIAAARRDRAVKIFLQAVGVPGIAIAVMRLLPLWRKLEAVAHTLPYDGLIVKDNQKGQPLTAQRWASATMPALVMVGGKSPGWMAHGNHALSLVLPDARYLTIEGQSHALKPKAHVRALVDFFSGSDRTTASTAGAA